MSSYAEEMQPSSMETQPPPFQRGKHNTQSVGLKGSSQASSVLPDDVSTTATTGGDSPTVDSLRNPIDPRRNSQDNLSASETNRDVTMTDKLQGKAQKVAGKLSRNAELYEQGQLRESGK